MMNSDAITSWFNHVEWFFMLLWIALLVAATAVSFREWQSSDVDDPPGSKNSLV
jgi:hypothetical protein